MKIKICIVCKSELPSRRTRFCSGTCSEFHDSFKRKRKSLRLSSLLTPRKCIGCSNMFQPKTDRHACCSKVCWDILTADRQKKRRAEKREELARKNPKGLGSTAGSGNRSRKIGTFGQPTAVNIPKTFVATAAFTNADTEERVELQSQVEEFLANGGKIMRYGAQPAITDADSITKWEISDEEQDVEIERYKGNNALHGN